MAASKNNNKGFTLLEILIVVAIMAAVLGLVGVNFGRNLDNVAYSEARRFARVLNFTKEYSAYTGRILSLRLDKKRNTYYFLYVDPVLGNWNRLGDNKGNKLLSPHKVNGLVRMRVEKRKTADTKDEVEQEQSKRRLFNSEIALITPFSDFEPVNLILSGETKDYIVTTDEFDDVEIQIQ